VNTSSNNCRGHCTTTDVNDAPCVSSARVECEFISAATVFKRCHQIERVVRKRTKIILMFLFTFVFITDGTAQQFATDVDMKNMYCVRVQLKQQEIVNMVLGLVPPNHKDYLGIKNEADTLSRNIDRMRQYGFARAKIVGYSNYNDAVTQPAVSRADADYRTLEACSARCPNFAEKPAQANACSQECVKSNAKNHADIFDRFKRCAAADWLPY
jgi:hypothetical protein